MTEFLGDFERPWALLLLALLPLYAWLRGGRSGSSALLYPDASLLTEVSRPVKSGAGSLSAFLRLLCAAALIVALAGPRTPNREIERESEGVDIMLVVDLSWSMMALDMGSQDREVTRWDVSQDVIREFIANRPDDRLGAVVFSGKPYLLSPLTVNKDWVKSGVGRLHIGSIRETGTAIGEAVAMAVDRMKSLPARSSKVIILLTDGDDNMSKAILPLPAAELAHALGVRLYAIGLGKDEPTVLPQFDVSTGKIYRDVLGRTVPMQTINPANYEMLGRMAAVADGRFYRALDRGQLAKVYDEIGRLERTEVRIRETVTYDSHRQAWIAAGLLLLLLELAFAVVRPRAP
ncbi:MAG: VWA domain-containing protein [Verrucomicrobia bacterium]|nr:VWA domain-containing protein [Verrucomicrobiota bacterium]